MTKLSSSFDWVREIKPDLKQLDSIPLTGAAPAFPWEEFSARLGRSFDRGELAIQPGEIIWRTKEELYEGLGDSPFPLTIAIPSLRGEVCWVMPSQEIDILAALLLTKETHPLALHDPNVSESFYRFLALELLYHFTQVSFDKTLSPILTSQNHLPDQDSLCWDISLRIHDQMIWGRLIMSEEFRHSWIEHFAQRQLPSPLSEQMAQFVDVTMHLEAGRTFFTLNEWKRVQLGDFILLETYSLDSEKLDGRVMLTINGKQAFRGKLKNGTLKILELPLLHEVETPMVKQPKDDEEDMDLPEEEFEEDEDLINEDEDFEEDEDLVTEDEDLISENEAEEESHAEEEEAEEAAKAPAEPPKRTLISPEEIPLALTVEVGQVKMTMDQVIKLEPGNLLEIDIHPENGVDLTINGKLVGKGELIRIGETLGVRILQLG
jgi:flagellar motor switch protein FliN